MVYGKKRQRDISETDHFDSTKGRVRITRRVDALTKLPHKGTNALVFVLKLDIIQPTGKSLWAISILEDVLEKG